MVIVKELNYINLTGLSEMLGFMNVKELNIFIINNELDNDTFYYIIEEKASNVRYLEVNLDRFLKILNSQKSFWDYNKNSLYILRGGNFLDIKNIFSIVNESHFIIGRGGSQKAHVISPLELRLTSYLMAMFNLDYNKVSKLNFFNEMSKERYLSFNDMSFKKQLLKRKKIIIKGS